MSVDNSKAVGCPIIDSYRPVLRYIDRYNNKLIIRSYLLLTKGFIDLFVIINRKGVNKNNILEV